MPLSNNYVPNVPLAGQQINNTQAPIEGNFQDIYDLLSINHVPFNTVNTFGRHNFVSYVNQSTDPLTSIGEMALYSKATTGSNQTSELFYRYPNNGSIVQLTGSTSTGGSTTSGGYFFSTSGSQLGDPGSGYWQYLSGGILIMNFYLSNYVTSGNSTSPYTFTFPGGISYNGLTVPSYTQPPFNAQITGQFEGASGTNVNYGVTITNNSSGTIYYNGPMNINSTIYPVLVTLIGI